MAWVKGKLAMWHNAISNSLCNSPITEKDVIENGAFPAVLEIPEEN